MKETILHTDAEFDLAEALKYYESQCLGLDARFYREFEKACERIGENSYLYAIEDEDDTRYCLFRTFPYMLVYIDMESHLWIVAVAHQHRMPRYGSKRLPQSDH